MSTETRTKPPIYPKPRPVCFSFAAYAKKIISHLKSSQVHITKGLTDDEICSIEVSFGFKFPPDLRSILSEGLPVSPEFPNWRSSSFQQLQILINLPILGICREISKRNLWFSSWGNRPKDPNEALNLAKQRLKKAPVLIPIYRYCYIPSKPNLAGNPVLFVKDGNLRYSGFDIAGFFQEVEFRERNNEFRPIQASTLMNSSLVSSWVGDLKVEFWSELVESSTENGGWKWVLEDSFEDLRRSLRKGGWNEEEVREMISTNITTTTAAAVVRDATSKGKKMKGKDDEKVVVGLRDKESVLSYLEVLSVKLVEAGWSKEDIFYSFGVLHDQGVLPDVDSNKCLDS